MALSSMVSKASPLSVGPLALRAISSAGSLHGSIITGAVFNAEREHVLPNRGGGSGTFVPCHQFSTVATAKKLLDSSLLKVLRSEIKTSTKYDVENQELPKTPASFPFTITDNPGERTITLIRDFPDETIEVKVRRTLVEELVDEEDDSNYDNSDGDSSSDDDNGDDCNSDEPVEEKDDKSSENEDNSDGDDGDSCSDDDTSSDEDDEDSPEEKKEPPSLPMSVTVCKKDGRRLKFELAASLDEIKVKHMSIEEYAGSELDAKVDFTGPDFEQLDHNLQHSLFKYLEIRGIKVNFISFLHKYMVAKSYKDDLFWLNKLKKFVKK